MSVTRLLPRLTASCPHFALLCFFFCSVALANAQSSPESWRAEADARIEKHRKGDLSLTVMDKAGNPLPETNVEIDLIRHDFHFGTAINPYHLTDTSKQGEIYRKLIVSHFTMVTDEYSMKWSSLEPEPGKRSFERGDISADFAAQHGLAFRGHCLLWGERQFMQEWLRALPPDEVRARAMAHSVEMAERYKGRVVSWDVINELVTGGWYDENLGPAFKFDLFEAVHKTDPNAALFLNEQHVLRNPEHLQKLLNLIASFQVEKIPIGGIGAQELNAHEVALERAPDGTTFRKLPPEVIWAHLDRLAETGIPIQLTEICAPAWDVNVRADALETLLRVAFAHQGVEAFILWGFLEGKLWKENGFLVHANGVPNEAGKRVFGLWENEWNTKLTVRTNAEGVARFRGFYGTYEVRSKKEGSATCKLSKKTPEARVTLARTATRNSDKPTIR